MGKVLSTIYKPLRDFNLESRAHKVISKTKPIPAPKHKSNETSYARLLKDHPNIEDSIKKDDDLNKRLRDVYVTSEESPMPVHPHRPLPSDRHVVEETDLGFPEPKKVPYGRVTLKSALKFISQHQTNAGEYPISKIAESYKLPEETVKNIVRYFRVYELYIPDQKSQTHFLGPYVSRRQIVEQKKIATNSTSQN